MWFTRVSIKNPIFAVMIMAGLMVLGLIGYQKMAVDQLPDVEIPIIVVQTNYSGAAPTSVENDISRPIEEAINTVSGIKTLSSRSYQGVSVVIAQFQMGVNIPQALQDVRAKVDRVRRNLPTDAEDPVITQNDPNAAPILSLAVTGSEKRSLRDLTDITENTIKPRLQTAHGVGEIDVLGGVKRQINVMLDANQMNALGVGINEVATAIKNFNQELPAGIVKNQEKEIVVQVKGRLQGVEDFRRLVVANRGGAPVYLEQIAKVEDGEAEKTSATLTDGQRTLSMTIIKSSGSNTLEVAQNVREQLAALGKSLPADIKVTTRQDQTISIQSSVNEVRNTIFEGALLAVMIVFLFLHSWRSTVITALTLPISIIGTFGFMYVLGFTINTLTLMAMSLSVGLLIDDAIVVRENIVRHMQAGKDHYNAAMDGTREIGLAVLATTLSIVAVFLPIGYMGGTIGQFFHQFGISVVIAVLLSMFVSFTLDPMLSSKWYDPDAERPLSERKGARLLLWFERHVEAFGNTYQNLLKRSLTHRKTTLLIAAVTFGLSLTIVPLVGSEFVPQGDYSEMNVKFKTPIGTSIEQTTEKSRQVQAILKSTFPEVDYSFVRIGGGTNSNNVATMYIKLKPSSERSRSVNDLLGPVRQQLMQVAGVSISKVTGQEGGPSGSNKRLVYNIQGPDLKRLGAYSDEVLNALKSVAGLSDLESSVADKKDAIDVVVNTQRASDLGVDTNTLSTVIAGLVTGAKAGTWRAPDDQDYDILLRLPADQRARPDDVANLKITTGIDSSTGQPTQVRIGDVAQFRAGTSATEVLRENLQREIQIDANPLGRSAGEVSDDVEDVLSKINWEPGYHYTVSGDAQDQKESVGYAASALMLAVVFIYMVLASQFDSFTQPIAIMSALPLSLIGVFLALLLFKSTVNIFSIVGFVLLMGLVTKNAILLIDFINQARAQGASRTDAILEAAHIRLRPILMTTLAMIFGMIPLGFALGEGAEQRAPMGQAVIGGTITSTLLTLVVVPVVYTYLDDGAVWCKQWWMRHRPND